MSTISERVLKIRKYNNLSRAAFGEKIGVSQDVINNIERGRNKTGVPDNIIKLISVTFNINEKWLRTGEGEMFNYSKEDTLLDRALSEYKLDDFQKNLVKEYLSLSLEQKNVVKSFLNKICNDSVFNNNENVKSSKYADIPTEQLLQETEARETELAKRDLSAFQKQDENTEFA